MDSRYDEIIRAVLEIAVDDPAACREDMEAAVVRFRRLVASQPPLAQRGLGLVLAALDLAPLVGGRGRLRGLAERDAAAGRELFRRWMRRGPRLWRQAPYLLATLAKLAYYSHPPVAARHGYDPPPPPVDAARDRRPTRGHHDGAGIGEQLRLRCDAVVVGSGAGGAVAAYELARGGLDVVLLEAGPYHDRRRYSRRPVDMMLELYRDGGATISVGNVPILIPTGIGVGGTTTINSGTCFRLPRQVVERWRRRFGLTDLDTGELDEVFSEIEGFLGVATVPRELTGRVGEIIGRGADALGFDHGPLRRNAPGCRGSGVCCFGCPEDAKTSMDLSYVPAALELGARLFSRTRAVELLGSGPAFSGVRAVTAGGGDITVRADVVLLALGTLATPGFLRRNLPGRPSRHLGRHMTIHPAFKMLGIMDETVRGWEAVPQGYAMHHLAEDQGIMFEGASVPPDVGAIGFDAIGAELARRMKAFDRTALFGFLVSDAPSGGVIEVGGRPQPWYWLKRRDFRKALLGLDHLGRVFFAAGAREVLTPVHGLGPLRSPADLYRLRTEPIRPADLEVTAFHPLGTCRMAASAREGVLDGRGRVHGTENLYVADGSIFPSSLGVNPQLSIMAFAARTARWIARGASGAAQAPRP